ELLPAISGSDIPVANARSKDVGERAQSLVPGGMPVAVVELLEVVDVQHEQSDRLLLPTRDERVLDGLIEGSGVGETRPCIGAGHALEGGEETSVADRERGVLGYARDARPQFERE